VVDRLRQRLAAWVPRWWSGDGGAAGTLLDLALWPVEHAYAGVMASRNAAFDGGWLRSAGTPIPVVSVGNLSVGGAGKTPLAAWIAGHLRGVGHRPAIVMRGYGRDEVLVHGELNPDVPVFADRDRMSAMAAAAAAGCDVAVWDDGFQHRGIRRSLDVVLVAAESLMTHPRLLPRGPWRERLRAAGRADVVVITRKSADRRAADRAERALVAAGIAVPVARCRLAPGSLRALHGPVEMPLGELRGTRVLAVAALASPTPFAEILASAGAEVELAAFPDHHEYSRTEASALVARARDRAIVTTLKDAVKLRDLLSPDTRAWIITQHVEWETGGGEIEERLRRAVAGTSP
jgi:tetraacyldisaccharide 4'-kinase